MSEVECPDQVAPNPDQPINGCEKNEPELSQDNSTESSLDEETTKSESNDDDTSNTPKTSRELKSILALSKEAKLDTNLSTQRRKTLDKVKTPTKRTKVTGFPVTAESELENIDEKKRRKFSEEGATSDETKRGLQIISGDFIMPRKPNKDIFCWRCHHDSVQVACETCPRAYHLRCLKQTITDLEHWPCPECVAILKAENTQTRSKAMKGMSLEHLCSLLKFAVKRMMQCNGSEPFIHPVDEKQFPEYRNYIVQPMTLTLLEKNIKENAYGSPQAFEADAKWLLHNSIIFNSYQSKLTSAAKTIVKICKQEMAEIENCPSCYLNANTKKNTWFVEVCPKPHLLVWAKLKGFPYWPAKVMSINSSGMADVRFFGAHDKAWVSVKDCYLYSIKDPNSGKQKRNDIIECVKELELYVDNLRQLYGRVNFAPFKTPLEPDSQLKQLQVFLPNYKSEGKELKKKNDESDSSESSEGEEDEEVENEEDEEKTKEGMTRIDYHESPTRKRCASETENEKQTKIAKLDEEKIETIEDEGSESPKSAKLRISDQLIKKLGDLSETVAPPDAEKVKENEKSKVEEKEENVIEEEAPKKQSKDETDVFPANKMVKLVPIENILQKKSVETNPNKQAEQLIVLKEIRVVKENKEVLVKKPEEPTTPIKIKKEVESDEDNDVQYMEAKRQYLSALNISEKQKVPMKPKQHEIRTRSKTEEKKTKKDETNQTKSAEPAKEIFLKSLTKMQPPKHKARKSFPTPNYTKKTIVARKLVPKAALDDDLTLVQPNVMILPKLHYTKAINTPPVLTLLPRPAAQSPSDPKKIPEGSQNYIPQNEEDQNRAGGDNTIILNNLLTASTTTTPIIDVDNQTTTFENDLGTLKDIVPETVTKGLGEILCQPTPPKLKPKPVSILSGVVESGIPSSAGAIATKINAMSQKLGDYFRSILIETVNELGSSNNPEATITSLKYEIEELNHKHSIELSEIRRNVSIVLKDIQKSVIEERERIINETKANCEIEMMKRVEEAKSKQWCANCSKEAQFYCCWNTSYCDYPCQQKHWPKHMSKCTQTANQNQSTSSPVRTTPQQLVLTPTTAPKFGALFAKPQKVYLKRANAPFKAGTAGSHITLVESTPGNYELLGSGPITMNGKILASTSVIEKIKSGNIVTVTAPSSATNTQLTSANQKVNTATKSTESEQVL